MIPPEQSPSLVELAKALSKFQGAIKSVPKRAVNPFFHSKYADLDAVWEMCRKPLTDNGLALIQTTTEVEGKVKLITTLIHSSGEYITGCYPITPMRQARDQGWLPSDDPQSMGSAITYARRYAMSAILGISADEDDDGEKASTKQALRRPATTPRDTTGASGTATISQPAPAPAATQPRPPANLTLCTLHGNIRMGLDAQKRRCHKLPDGTFCYGVAPEAQLDTSDVDEPPDTTTPLGELQREVNQEDMAWTVFEDHVLKMTWPEWVKLGGTTDTARTRWAAWKQQQTEKGG